MTQDKFCGILRNSKEGSVVYLPLTEVHVQAMIIDVSARVTLSQVFSNPTKVPTSSAKYVFPVPARGAVCAFEMRTEDGRIIKGIAKEKMQAAAEHEQAIRQRRATGLVEWATDDVFTISIGTIPAEQKLTTKLTYIVDLMNDGLADQIRFQLPMYVGTRYGSFPDTMLDAIAPASSTRVRIEITIQTKGNIQSVTSPSHSQLLAYPFEGDDGKPSSNRMIGSYESPEFLKKDFVVQVQARGLDAPRCFAERYLKHGSVSLQLTMVPDFNLPPITSQEYIFLVDRSGSMAGSRIETAKRTLVMLLHALPASGTSFNIFSFGSHSTKMSPSSLEYTQDSLTSATEHVDAMSADHGGTEIRSALENVFHSRNEHLPTAVFVLTDGEAYDISSTIHTVTQAVSKSQSSSPLRVFVLGIGGTASTAMCEGIARAGNGVCLMATTSENILGKCSKLVHASRTYVLRDISVDWGAHRPTETSPMERETNILQAPSKIESIYPGLRFVVTAIIKENDFEIPEEVVLRGKQVGNGEIIEIKVPVQIELTKDDDTCPLINTLAARRMITELEDPKNESKLTPEQKKNAIIRIGEEYQLASRFTSFVAVGDHISKKANLAQGDGSSEEAPNGEEEEDWTCEPVSGSSILSSDPLEDGSWIQKGRPGRPKIKVMDQRKSALPVAGTNNATSILASPKPSTTTPTLASTAPLIPVAVAPRLESPFDANLSDEDEPGFMPRAKSFVRIPKHSAQVPRLPSGIPKALSPGTPQGGSAYTDPPVVRLVRLQAFNGSFTLNDEFTKILGKDVVEKGRAEGVDDTIWATALAVAFFRKYLADQPELLGGLVEKAVTFVGSSPLGKGVDFDALVRKAKELIV